MIKETKCLVQNYKKSINESLFTLQQSALVWDFYVTKSIASSTAQGRKITDYGLSKIPYEEMLEIANITKENVVGLLANSMPKTLKRLDLQIAESKNQYIEIDIETCRMAYLIPYTIADNEKPKAQSNSGKGESLLRHIRNAFAHGNTYFFDNGNVLLEDKHSRMTTAMILLHQQTLLDWIALIDKEQRFYILRDVCKSCSYFGE